ncbi:LPXTG cell wall anchor domain-containing protein [Kitasatospora phosalacinea]|uniref:LPXTG cell wall anchor domain-containing protein n=1 Tax=Kitasatospora phosalacinea TaxID=2065 RepID=UPI0036619C90
MRRSAAGAWAILVLLATCWSWSAPAGAVPPSAPFAAYQYGTDGCLEVGARDTQPKPYAAPAGYDPTAGYPAFGYDPAALGFTVTGGTNACRYKFYDKNPRTDPSAVYIASGYCVQYAAGQLSGTGYDPQDTAAVRNAGYIRRILAAYWPNSNLPAVPSSNATVANRQRSGAVAMAVHWFSDGIAMPPDYQVPELYASVKQVVDGALAAGPLTAPADPTPALDGPLGGDAQDLVGPFTIGANALGPVTVRIDGAGVSAYRDAAGTVPFTSGDTLPPGGQLWLRGPAGPVVLHAEGPVQAETGTYVAGDPAVRVQSMMLAAAVTLTGKTERTVTLVAGDPPRLSSQVSATVLTSGDPVFDSFDVAGLRGPATLVTTLFGPLPVPGSGDCAQAGWDPVAVPVAAEYVPIRLTGDGRVVVPERDTGETGCFSFGAELRPEGADPVHLPPGDPAETFRVDPREVPPLLTLTTLVSATTLPAGREVTDTLTVTGITAGGTVHLEPALYGPLAPAADGGCAGLDWAAPDLPVAARLAPHDLTADGSVTTEPVRLTAAGCYSFDTVMTHTVLTGGQERVGHGIGSPEETLLVEAAVEPSPSPSASPSGTPTPSPSASAGPSAGTSPSASATAGPVHPLPDTGADETGAVLAAALALLLLGSAALAVNRRR